jgi:hypothetical protein
MSLADDADKLSNRVHAARRFAPLARVFNDAVSILGDGLCLLAQPAQPFEHAFLPCLHEALDSVAAAITLLTNGWATCEPSVDVSR